MNEFVFFISLGLGQGYIGDLKQGEYSHVGIVEMGVEYKQLQLKYDHRSYTDTGKDRGTDAVYLMYRKEFK